MAIFESYFWFEFREYFYFDASFLHFNHQFKYSGTLTNTIIYLIFTPLG